MNYKEFYKKAPIKQDMLRLIRQEGANIELLEQFKNIKKKDWNYINKGRTLNSQQKRAFDILKKQKKNVLGKHIIGLWEEYPTWWQRKYEKTFDIKLNKEDIEMLKVGEYDVTENVIQKIIRQTRRKR